MNAFFSHTSFEMERELPGRPKHAFRFWAERDLKRQWTSCHPDWTVLEETFDIRRGGVEELRWRTPEGVEQGFHAYYLDVVPGKELVYAYRMSTGSLMTSASLVTIGFTGKGQKTKMTYNEQAAFREAGDAEIRSGGTEIGFDRLVLAIEKSLAVAH